MRKGLFILFSMIFGLTAAGADPTATDYSYEQCQGSAMPYPTPDMALRAIPDSLTPIYINHVGRHGARFLSSSKYTTALLRYLNKADSLNTITPAGRELMNLCNTVVSRTAGRWGALDSLGMAEQRGIASRLHVLAPKLFRDTKINAISSYVPRCVASMDEFTHQLTRLDNKVEIYTSSGRQNSPLVRPWTDDRDYKEYMDSEGWHDVYDKFLDATIPATMAPRILGAKYPFSPGEAQDVALAMYKVVAGCGAMSVNADAARFFTREEYNALWSVGNLHHYLTHSASTLSQAPMNMTAALLNELIETMDKAANGENQYSVMLRFGHAETMMPLLALMRLQGCYYMTNYFDTVGVHWQDFHVVPMASNIQMILLRSDSGRLYVRVDFNEVPTPLIPGKSTIYTPWESAKEYLTRCLPLYLLTSCENFHPATIL
ncbi:MAG: histidine phosphatase family protein [Duncaniella sp.]|nr:histidine phosphatase family protein [Duncaniella sp.]